MTLPIADDYAMAIVTACKITGENPESFRFRDPDAKFRHYALHALIYVFPDLRHLTASVADRLGCPGKPGFFMRSSLWYVLGHAPQSTRKPLGWWNPAALDTVIKALEKRQPLPAPKGKDVGVVSIGVKLPAKPAPVHPALQAQAPRPLPKDTPATEPPEPDIERNGIVLSYRNKIVSRGGNATRMAEPELIAVGMLLKVMPAILPADRIAAKLYGTHVDGIYLTGQLLQVASEKLAVTGLTIKTVPKMGYTLFAL